MRLSARTDLASEARPLLSGELGEKQGVIAHEETKNGLKTVCVEILNDEGAKALGKPVGRYYTLSLSPHFARGDESFPQAAQTVGALIRRCIGARPYDSCLIAALGNPDVTPDALGSLAASSILVTRHLKQSQEAAFGPFLSTALCRTGVLGTTGVESAVQIRSLCAALRPSLVIAVDALAGSQLDGLCRCIQICDSGIAPGSGVGNNREELSEKALGVPVIAVGVPTVIDASAFSGDEALAGMFVTPRGIDSLVRAAGRLIGYGINLALHPGLTLADIDMLLG